MYTKLRNKVPCDCKTCNGKYVEYRTRKSHIELERNLASCISGFLPENSDNSIAHVLKVCHSPIAKGSSRSKEKVEQEESTSFDGNYESDFAVFVPPKKAKTRPVSRTGSHPA